MEHKKYMDIERLKETFADGFEVGDEIIVQEKIDGANASWQYDEESNTLQSFSRRKVLDFKETLRGFYQFVQELHKEEYKTSPDVRVFSEWLVLHTVPYPQDAYNKAYVYDLYDTKLEKYLPQDEVKEFCEQHNLIYSPVLYSGKFTSWDEILKLVGQTKLGGEYGEGIVVKNMTKLNNPNTRKPFYTKIVCEKFSETKGQSNKIVDPEKLKEREVAREETSRIVTEARVIKLLHKMVDDGIISEDWDEKSMSIIAKMLPREVYNDCVKEENDIVISVGSNFGKFASSITMGIVKEELNRRK